MEFIFNAVGIAIVFVWLYFLIAYPSERQIEHRTRSTIRSLHGKLLNERDELASFPNFRGAAPRRNGHLPTIVAGNRTLTALYWNVVYDEQREEEVLWIGTAPVVAKGSWRLQVVWQKDPHDRSWRVTEWYVDGRLPFLPIPEHWFTEKCLLAEMLRAVKIAKASSRAESRQRNI